MAGGGAEIRAGEEAARGIIAKAAKSALRDAEKAVTKDAAKRGVTQAPKDILKGMEKDLVGRLSHEGHAAIEAFARRSAEAEKIITPKLDRIAAETPGTELAGREFRLKSAESLERKVASDVVHGGQTVEDAIGKIKDAVRYTFKSSREDYTRVTDETIGKLKDAGFEPVGEKNFWRNESGYQGINSVWRDSETGHMIEIQFHSAESLAAKEGTHGIYDFQRLPSLDSGVTDYLNRLQDGVFGLITRPSGAAGIEF